MYSLFLKINIRRYMLIPRSVLYWTSKWNIYNLMPSYVSSLRQDKYLICLFLFNFFTNNLNNSYAKSSCSIMNEGKHIVNLYRSLERLKLICLLNDNYLDIYIIYEYLYLTYWWCLWRCHHNCHKQPLQIQKNRKYDFSL